MNKYRYVVAICILCTMLFLLFPHSAYASSMGSGLSRLDCTFYIDPGTGSLILQLLIGAMVGGWYVAKNYWLRIKSFFSKLGKADARHDPME